MFIRLLVLGGFYGGVNRGDTPSFLHGFVTLFTWLSKKCYEAFPQEMHREVLFLPQKHCSFNNNMYLCAINQMN